MPSGPPHSASNTGWHAGDDPEPGQRRRSSRGRRHLDVLEPVPRRARSASAPSTASAAVEARRRSPSSAASPMQWKPACRPALGAGDDVVARPGRRRGRRARRCPGRSAYGAASAAVREPNAPSAIQVAGQARDAESPGGVDGAAARPSRRRRAARPRRPPGRTVSISCSGPMCGAAFSWNEAMPLRGHRAAGGPGGGRAGPSGPIRLSSDVARTAWWASRSTRPSSLQPSRSAERRAPAAASGAARPPRSGRRRG